MRYRQRRRYDYVRRQTSCGELAKIYFSRAENFIVVAWAGVFISSKLLSRVSIAFEHTGFSGDVAFFLGLINIPSSVQRISISRLFISSTRTLKKIISVIYVFYVCYIDRLHNGNSRNGE